VAGDHREPCCSGWRSYLHLHLPRLLSRESIHFGNVANIRLSLMVRYVRENVLVAVTERTIGLF